jgi:hypothetical protein
MAVSEHGLSRNDIHGKNSFNQLPGPAVSLTALIGMPLKTACPQGVALAQNGFNQLPVPAVYLSPSPRRENCARKLTVPCGQSASVPVPGALHRASRGRSWLLVVGEWQVLLSTDVTGLQTFAETFARMACLSPGRRLGVVGRRRGFFLSGAVPQKIPVNLLPKSIGSSSRNWRGLPVKLCPTATLLLTVYESVPRRDFRSSKIAFVDFVKTACPQGVAFKGRGGRPIGVRGPTRIRFPVCTGTVSTNCLSPRENCLSPAPPRAVCRWGMASFDPGPMPRVCRHSRGPSREWRVFPHGVPIASP